MKILMSCWGYDAFKMLFESKGHEVESFSFKEYLDENGSAKGSSQIVKHLQDRGANIAIFERGSSASRIPVSPKSIRKMKRIGIRPVLIHWDIPLVKNIEDITKEHIVKFYGKSVLYYDTVFITFPRGVELLREMGVNAHLIYKAVDHQFQPHIYGLTVREKTYDVSICGTSYGKCRFARGFERSEIALKMIELAKQDEIKFGIFGKGWIANSNDPFNDDKYYSHMRGLVAKSYEFEPYFDGKEKQANIGRIFALSKINIGTLLVNYENYWGARPFEVLGANSFLLLGNLHPASNLLKDGEHFVKFNNHDDLVDKVRYYLDNESERDKISRQGFDYIMTNHTARHRAEFVLETLGLGEEK